MRTKIKKGTKILFEIIFVLAVFVFFGVAVFFGREFYLKERNTGIEVKIEGKSTETFEISKGDALVAEFETSVLQSSVEDSFSIEGDLEYKKEWKGKRYLRIEILEYPHPEETYHLSIENIRTKFYIPMKQEVDVDFRAIQPPGSADVSPADGHREVDYEERIEIQLNRSMPEEYFVEFKSEPKIKFDYEINEERTKITIIPLQLFERHQRYDLEMAVKHRAFEDYENEIYAGHFVTKQPPEIVYNFDKDGNSLKTQIRNEEVKPQIMNGRYIDIDLSQQALFIFEDGLEKGAFKVSTGKRGMETPIGTFEVMGKASRPWSKKYELFMPWFIQFTSQGHGIHELPEWPGGVKEGVHHLGIPVSHGCVRLGIGPAKVVYDFVDTGTPIVIHE